MDLSRRMSSTALVAIIVLIAVLNATGKPARSWGFPNGKVHAELVLDSRNNYISPFPIVMRCLVQGYPELHVSWFKDDVRLYHSERFQISEQPYYLVVNDATPKDSGKYTCRASNGYAHSKDEANVVIKLDDKTYY